MRESGRSILFIGHNIHHVYDIAERFVVIDRGRVAMEKKKSEVGSAQELIEFMERVARPQDVTGRGDGAMTEVSRMTDHATAPTARHPAERPLRKFLFANRAALGSLAVFVVMLLVFFVANPRVFSTWGLYAAVLTTLPVALFMVAPLVFVVTSGEIDLSFPAMMGFASLAFALCRAGRLRSVPRQSPPRSYRQLLGFGVGALVVYGGLSSLVATLGMNFMLRGLILIITKSKSIAVAAAAGQPRLQDHSPPRSGASRCRSFWAIAFVVFCALLYNRHRFGAQVHVVGDNPDSANEMGINVKLVRVKVFVFMGVGAALAGVFSTMINFTWWPTSGDGYLLPVIASVFVGGTPPWGGIGTVLGGAIGALTVCLHPDRRRGRRPVGLLRPVLLRPDHHPVAARPSLEPGALSLTSEHFGRPVDVAQSARPAAGRRQARRQSQGGTPACARNSLMSYASDIDIWYRYPEV